MSSGSQPLEVPAQVVDYLQEHHTLTLATASPSGLPRASTYLYVSDAGTLYFWSRPETVTARQIAQNPIVSFTIDHYSDDLSQTKGIQGVGECSVLLSGEQIARVADLFGQKFPSLSPGSTMSISFFRITPTEIQFIDNTTVPHGSGRGDAFGAEFHRERSFSVIAALPQRPASSVVASLPRVTVPAGETIVRQGGPADRFLILVEGAAEIIRAADGQEHQLGTLSAGQLFGEVSIMRDQPRAASVRAIADCTLLALDRDIFRDLIAQSMEITPDFDQVIRSRLGATGD